MRLYVTALTAAALLLIGLTATATAAAKEVSAVSVCGASGCNDVDDVRAFMAAGGLDTGSPDERPIPAAQPYFRMEVEMHAPGEDLPGWSVFLLADGSLVRAQGPGAALDQDWMTLPADAGRTIASATDGLEPYPAPKLTDVRIGGRRATDPASYSDLFGLKAAPKPTTVSPGGWERIDVRSAKPSPWTDGGDRIDWSPSLGVIRVDGLYFEPGAALSDRLSSDTGRSAPKDGDDPSPLPWLVGIVIAALGGAVVFMRIRRRPGPATA